MAANDNPTSDDESQPEGFLGKFRVKLLAIAGIIAIIAGIAVNIKEISDSLKDATCNFAPNLKFCQTISDTTSKNEKATFTVSYNVSSGKKLVDDLIEEHLKQLGVNIGTSPTTLIEVNYTPEIIQFPTKVDNKYSLKYYSTSSKIWFTINSHQYASSIALGPTDTVKLRGELESSLKTMYFQTLTNNDSLLSTEIAQKISDI